MPEGEDSIDGKDWSGIFGSGFDAISKCGDMKVGMEGVVRKQSGSVKDIAQYIGWNFWMGPNFEAFADPHTSMA